MTAEQFAALAPSGAVTSASIASPPVVTFQVTDANGRGIKGLGFTSQSSTALLPGYSNLAFSMAKLVPGTNGGPSKWVSYIVTSSPQTADITDPPCASDQYVEPSTGKCAPIVPSRPSTDNIGTLVDNGDGTYKYTFYRDITKVKDLVAAATVTAPDDVADLGDLTYDPTKLHRVAVQVAGYARGTGTNTADGSNSGLAAVPMSMPLNIIFDWYPATGEVVGAAGEPDGRDIVKMSACFECHGKFTGFHVAAAPAGKSANPASRQDTRMCVLCHTEQRRYGRTEAAITGNTFSGSTRIVDGRAVGDFPNMVHKIHLGHYLAKHGYDYAGVEFNHVTYPQDPKNCNKCHNGADGAANKTAQGDNWKSVPTRLACGACHDGINFATGRGVTLADAREGLTTSQFGHVGGAQADDKNCALCHGPTAIPVYHVTVDPTGSSGRGGYPPNTATDVPTPGYPSGQGPAIPLASQLNLPAGVYKIDFEIKQVTVSGAAGARQATVVYRILKDGQPVTLNATGNLIDGVDGSPGIYVTYATTQDGIAAPADWNASKSASVMSIRDGASGNSQTGPDASGYYTATLGATIPDDARMVTAAVGVDYQGFVQLNHADYPKGIRLREPKFVMKVADGQTARRAIVNNDKCNNCHGQLGVSPSFHSGARNNGEGCAICHDASRATGHVGPNNSFGGGWSVSGKNMVHAIHASAKREQAFSYEATAENPDGFGEVTYPGILKNCETCHVAGSYDFTAAANNAALPSLVWTTDARGNMLNDAATNPTGITPIGLSPWVTTLGQGQIDYRNDNLVSSPIASACFGCHDSSLAV
ncbi:MAG: hypothetical protein A3G24_08745, partial [Betaproteobacteria bacterium RIFCSPLOWO2_12_FULL_62_13]